MVAHLAFLRAGHWVDSKVVQKAVEKGNSTAGCWVFAMAVSLEHPRAASTDESRAVYWDAWLAVHWDSHSHHHSDDYWAEQWVAHWDDQRVAHWDGQTVAMTAGTKADNLDEQSVDSRAAYWVDLMVA